MHSGEEHRGAEAPGVMATRGDARVARITDLLLEHDVHGRSAHRPTQDPQRGLQLQQQRFDQANPIGIGLVVHAIPFLNWYKVQFGIQGGGWAGCCRLAGTNCIPLGPRDGNPVAAGSRVLVYRQRNSAAGVILGVLPHQLEDGRAATAGVISQGSGVGLKWEAAHRQPLQGMYKQGGVQDFSCQAPVDVTSMDRVVQTDTGVTWLVSPFEAMLYVNELCGLFLNLWDSHTTLTGWNLSILSAGHELAAGHDEGETRFRELLASYPWEAVGAYAPDQGDTCRTFDDVAIQYQRHKGKVDLPDGGEDVQPVYRVQRYGGYEGQGGLRLVARPARTTGLRRFSEDLPDQGLFTESVGLDGSVLWQSAKSLFIVKRCQIAVPRPLHADEDPRGDDAVHADYKSSSQFGTGPAHQIGDVAVPTGAPASLLRVAGVQDLIAHATSWKRLHPFHYRSRDYRLTPAAVPFTRVNEVLDFTVLAAGGYLSDAEPVFLNIDHRYHDVAYYLRESFLAFHEDGSVSLGGGGGEQIDLAGGRIRLTCPGGVDIVAGSDVVVMAADVVLKAQDSVDVSASRHDVRLWGHQNVQIGAGGGLLLEARGTGLDQHYQDRIGEDVVAAGVVVKSAGALALLGDDLYLRSGSGGGAGDIVLDAARSDGTVVLQATDLDCFLTGAAGIWHFASADGSAEQSHRFASDGAHHGGSLSVGGDVRVGVLHEGSLLVNGSVGATRDIAAGGQASSAGAQIDKTERSYVEEVRRDLRQAGQDLRALTETGGKARQALTTTWYAPLRLGNDEVAAALGFSYRDADQPGRQYRTTDFLLPEARWQAMARLGGATGGLVWAENPVSYQGRLLYPWPGRTAWAETEAFLRLSKLTMYDVPGGRDHDRPGPYEAASLAVPERRVPAQTFTLLARQESAS